MPLGSFYTAVQEDKMVLRGLFFPHEQRPAGKRGASISGNVAARDRCAHTLIEQQQAYPRHM